MRVRLVYNDNGGGLTRDAELIAGALEAVGVRIVRYRLGHRNLAQRFSNRISRLTRRGRAHANIFIENGLSLGLLATATRSILIPNPEWMDDTTLGLIRHIDMIACKSADAVAAMSGFGRPTALMRFTTQDRLLEGRRGLEPRALHVVGRSPNKGTGAVYEAWRRHPEWPLLTIVALDEVIRPLGLQPAPNIRLTGAIPDASLRALQNEAMLHVCPSECEGYGHTVAEAMSCGALVVSTDAPPMNEIVGPGRGILVAANGSEPLRMGRRYRVTTEAVEEGVRRALATSAADAARIGEAARQWFLENDRRFRETLPAILSGVVAGAQPPQASPS